MARTIGKFRLQPQVIIPSSVSLDLPGIYQWEITYADGRVQRYIGKYTRRRRPEREYYLNVERLIEGRPYRRNNPNGFRHIHRELAQAAMDGRKVVLTILENVPLLTLALRERELIQAQGATLNANTAETEHGSR